MDADLGQEALTLMTYPLPKGPPPNTITLGVRIEHINLEGGEHKHSNHSTLRQLKGLGESKSPTAGCPQPTQGLHPSTALGTQERPPLRHWNPCPTALMVAGQSNLAPASVRPGHNGDGEAAGPNKPGV